MDPLPPQHLISTKEASKVSGYHGDYLSRLARTGKIAGQRLGRNWLIDPKSLDLFLKQQRVHKIVSAQTLANIRSAEYQKKRTGLPSDNHSASRASSFELESAVHAFTSQAIAVAAAVLVVGSAALMAETSYLPNAAMGVQSFADNFASGFESTFGQIPAEVGTKLLVTRQSIERRSAETSLRNSQISSEITSDAVVQINQLVSRVSDYASASAFYSESPYPSFAHAEAAAVAAIARENGPLPGSAPQEGESAVKNFQERMQTAYEMVSSPARLSQALRNGYQSALIGARAAAVEPRALYRSFVLKSRGAILTFGISARDWVSQAPQFVTDMNLALGSFVIDSTHAAIQAEVALAYVPSFAAPASARAVVSFLGNAGDALERATSRVPSLAVQTFLKTTELPSIVAPKIAEAVFSEEYAAASRFISVTDKVEEHYATILNGLGRSAYAAARGAISLASVANTFPNQITKWTTLGAGTSSIPFSERPAAITQPQVAAVASAIPTLPSAQPASTTPVEGLPPVIRLTGPAALKIAVGDLFKDPGATAFDREDGNLSPHIVVSGTVDPEVPGLYTIIYTAADSSHNVASVSRLVSVVLVPQTVSPVGTRRSINSADPFSATR
jgi:Bacterial surface protein, Ig-like domain